MADKELLTIITPTYNRAYSLPRVYASLLEQTCKDFLWMVVDDGSTDSTAVLISDWIAKGKLDITYVKKKNGGKASALNEGLEHLRTKFVVCLDSDDTFFPDAVENALIELERIDADSKCCGILALRSDSTGQVMGGKNIPISYDKATAADIITGLHPNAETICFYKSEIISKYRFPIFENEKFLPPSWMMYTITKDYYYTISRTAFCCCEYLSDGLTKNKKEAIKKNPVGYTCIKKLSFENSTSFLFSIKDGILYNYGTLLIKDKGWLANTSRKLLAVILRPFGLVLYFLRKFKLYYGERK